MLLLATTVQAAHSCGFQIADAPARLQFQNASSGSSLCTICRMAQSATVALLFVAFFLNLHRGAGALFPQMQPRPFLVSFQLYVRPPPAQ
jgi:hypothetical protein